MNKYIVFSTLHDADKSYEVFAKRINTYRSQTPLNDSSWLITTEDDREEVYHYLREAIDAEDDLVIIELGPDSGFIAWLDDEATGQLEKVFA